MPTIMTVFRLFELLALGGDGSSPKPHVYLSTIRIALGRLQLIYVALVSGWTLWRARWQMRKNGIYLNLVWLSLTKPDATVDGGKRWTSWKVTIRAYVPALWRHWSDPVAINRRTTTSLSFSSPFTNTLSLLSSGSLGSAKQSVRTEIIKSGKVFGPMSICGKWCPTWGCLLWRLSGAL